VRLSGEEREQLEALIRKRKSRLEAFEGRRCLGSRRRVKRQPDRREALATSSSMVYWVRKQLVEEGFEAVLSRKPRATPPAIAWIFA
jgi:hypothetical protein